MSTNCHAILAERDIRFLNVTVAKLWVCANVSCNIIRNFLSPNLVISRFQRFKTSDSVGKMTIVPNIDDKFNSYSKVILLCLYL
jgi:hypothetical protein